MAPRSGTKKIDSKTKLLVARGKWNYADTAADCYPFFCWAAYMTDKDVFNGPVRDMLHAEIKLCNHLDRIPVPYDFKKKAKDVDQSYESMVFGASEYAKDGLVPIVEITGKDEWFDRMVAIEDDIWKNARLDTPFGKIPSIPNSVQGIEIDGEQLQVLTRLYSMTGEKKYLVWAERLGDYYLKRDGFLPPQLRDHGCEIIGGLGLLLAVESEIDSNKLNEYLPPFKKMLDAILDRGCNSDGFMYDKLDGCALPPYKAGSLSDGWGYNYVSYICYDMIDGRPQYRSQIERTLNNLTQLSCWKGDSLADSAEGAMYLLNRYPIPQAFRWIDCAITSDFVSDGKLKKDRMWSVNKWDANCIRTVIIHAMMHTQGVIARPWRRDMQLGACRNDDTLAIVLKAKGSYSGHLDFDIPRHRIYMGFQSDWPRMNTLLEWFTVEPEETYIVENLTAGTVEEFKGNQLHNGFPVQVEADRELRLLVRLKSTHCLSDHTK